MTQPPAPPSASDRTQPEQPAPPSDWVRRWLPPVAPDAGATLLDVACGGGRHARLALALGYRVVAVDHDPQACADVPDRTGLQVRVEDLERGDWSFGADRFDAIVMTRYLDRARLPALAGLLAPGGRLIVETFADGQAAYGRPRRPEFLLQPDELAGTLRAAGLWLLAFEQGVQWSGEPPAPRSVLQRAVGVRPPLSPQATRLPPVR